jgi:hypothetical protein
VKPGDTAAAVDGARPKGLSAATLCEAFQLTAEEGADTAALRLKDSLIELAPIR